MDYCTVFCLNLVFSKIKGSKGSLYNRVLLLPNFSPKSTSELQTLLPGEDTHFSKVEHKEFIPRVHTQLGCNFINKFLMIGIHHCLFMVGKLGSLF